MSETRRALVVSTGKNAAWVSLDGENVPRLAQLRRQSGKRFMPVPGDVVFVRILEDAKTLVDRIEPRAFTLERRTIEGRSKIIAANVDTLVTVTALADPPPRLVTLDQLLAFAELESIGTLVVFTKPDLAKERVRDELVSLYKALGYQTIVAQSESRRERRWAARSDQRAPRLALGDLGRREELDLQGTRRRCERRRSLALRLGAADDFGCALV